MENIKLMTADPSLKKELESILPKGVRLEDPETKTQGMIIFFDIDSMKPKLIQDLHGKHIVVGITGQKKTEPVMEATAFGAYEIIQRPLSHDIVTTLLQELRIFSDEIRDTIPLASQPPTPTCVIVGHSPIIMDVCKKLARLAQVDAPVLITGETGTGKELIAESIAQLSSRFGKPFVVVNCAAMPETLLESELFGFEKGSFTGAVAAKEGILKIADEGCVFLDEVGELPLALQSKLLRFLQTQSFYPIGSTREVQVNVRVISATNRDLSAMVQKGTFREDLFHRLRVTTIHIPPLRERKKDIKPLVHFFLNRYRHTGSQPILGFTKAFLKRLVAYDWTGNIRELENTIRSAIALSKTLYLTTHELHELGSRTAKQEGEASEVFSASLVALIKNALELQDKHIYDKIHHEVDKTLFSFVLEHSRENQSEAARLLGINRLTLRKKLGMMR